MAEQQNNLKIHRLPFTQVPNDLLCSDKISGMAKALWCVFYSKPDNWTFYWREIESNFKEGREAVRNAARQLEEMGYLKKTQKKINSGKGMVFGGMDIELFPYPNQQTQPSSSNTGFQYTRNSNARESDSSDADSSKPSSYKEIEKQDLSKKDLNNSSSLPTLEIAKKFAEEEELKIDVDLWLKISQTNGVKNWKSAMIKWAGNPKNQIKESAKITPTEKPSEILNLENRIKKAMFGNSGSFDFDLYFLGNIELIEGQFYLKKAVPEKFKWVLKEFNLKNKS